LAAKPHSFCQRVEDNAFHLGWIGFSEDDAKTDSPKAQTKAKQAATLD
jgi:hypothetical protein